MDTQKELKGYRLWNINKKKIVVRRDVVFIEDKMPILHLETSEFNKSPSIGKDSVQDHGSESGVEVEIKQNSDEIDDNDSKDISWLEIEQGGKLFHQ